jgi:hypothetical protein
LAAVVEVTIEYLANQHSGTHDQGISKAGNRKGRTTGIELAWLWLRYQPDSDLSVWFRARVGTVKGRIRRIAIVALPRAQRSSRPRASL